MMLKAAFQYSYINAKIRSLKSMLLKRIDYENMSRISGYEGLVECLKRTSFALKWKNYQPSFDGLIQMYYEDLFSSYDKVIEMLSGNRKKLIQHLYQKYEMENLKVILRIISSEKSNKKLTGKSRYLLSLKKKTASFSAKDLLKAKNVDEIIYLLQGTWYGEPLKHSLYRFALEKETFPLEMALDLFYYKRLWQHISSLSYRERKIAQNLLGVQYDILNIFWIFRFKKMFYFSPEEILNYSLMHGKYLSANRRLKLAYSVDYNDMLNNLIGTPYKELLAYSDDPEICYRKLLSYKLSLARKNWQGFPFQIGTILDYLVFKEIEIRDLISLTEANRLSLSFDKVKDYFIYNHYAENSESTN